MEVSFERATAPAATLLLLTTKLLLLSAVLTLVLKSLDPKTSNLYEIELTQNFRSLINVYILHYAGFYIWPRMKMYAPQKINFIRRKIRRTLRYTNELSYWPLNGTLILSETVVHIVMHIINFHSVHYLILSSILKCIKCNNFNNVNN